MKSIIVQLQFSMLIRFQIRIIYKNLYKKYFSSESGKFLTSNVSTLYNKDCKYGCKKKIKLKINFFISGRTVKTVNDTSCMNKGLIIEKFLFKK